MVWRNLVIVLIALSLAGIGNAQEKKLEPLIVSYSSFTGNRAPLWIAKELGLYEKYGLDVKLVSIAAGSVSHKFAGSYLGASSPRVYAPTPKNAA